MIKNVSAPFSRVDTSAPPPCVSKTLIAHGNVSRRFVPFGITTPVCATDTTFDPTKTAATFWISLFTDLIRSYTTVRLPSIPIGALRRPCDIQYDQYSKPCAP